MNTKTAKNLHTLAVKESKEKGYPLSWTLKQLKQLWKQTPKHKKYKLFI
jgi:hypothetical protein